MKNGHFEYSISDKDKTGIYVISVTDERTGFVVRTAIPDHGKQTASLMAFAGARFSRSSDTTEDIFAEIQAAGKNAQEKLANIFRNYGHASVADMANIFLYIENIPKHYEARFFNETSIGGGQGRSSRYQDFGNGTPVSLTNYLSDVDSEADDQFKKIQQTGINYFVKWRDLLKDRYTDYFKIDSENKREVSALSARIFDTSRAFLTSGLSTRTSIGWVTNAREWARLIGVFKGSEDTHFNYLAEQIEALLAPTPEIAESLGYIPEAPDLIRHTEADQGLAMIKTKLKTFLQENGFEESLDVLGYDGERYNLEGRLVKPRLLDVRLMSEYTAASHKVIIENIMLLYPSVEIEYCQSFLYSLKDEQIAELGEILFEGFDHHAQMGVTYRVNQLSYRLDLSNAEAIDLNRHRAWGRFSPLWSCENNSLGCLDNGYILPLYISNVPEFADLKEQFIADLDELYAQIIDFVSNHGEKEWFQEWIIPQILPLAHNARMIMHGSVKEVSYMTKLRVRPGGQINYRDIAWQMANQTAYSDPLLANLEIKMRPDPSSREEFVDRS